MMSVRFLGQGLRVGGNSTGNTLLESFQDVEFSSFICFVAFAGVTGIEKLKSHILTSKSHITDWKTFVGIDLKGTSKEALEALLELDINT